MDYPITVAKMDELVILLPSIDLKATYDESSN